MIFTIAWRNIWRNKIRSWVVIGSILVGIWSILFLLSFSYAMTFGYINSSIRHQTSHLQLHHPEWGEEKEVKYLLPNAEKVWEKISQRSDVESSTVRTLVNGMIRSSRGARGIMIKGVEPKSEAEVTRLNEKIVNGTYFTENKRNEIIISSKLAERLKLAVRKKVVLQFQDINGDIVAGSFRISGLFDTKNTLYDESFVMVNRKDLNRILEDTTAAHEIAIFLADGATLDTTSADLRSVFSNLLLENYRELSPDVQLYESQIDVSARIFTFIFMLALIFGIINTMLMAVLERNKELGMLMALGMGKIRVFLMIVAETLLLGLVALPFGLLLSWLTIGHFGVAGIDLTAFSAAIEQYGLDTIIYPTLPKDQYWSMTLSVLMTALLASVYPALKAIRLRPVEAMRKI